MNNNTIKFLSTKKDVGSRLDILLAKKITNLTRSNLKKIIELRKVRINNSIVSAPSKKIRLNESIIVNLEQEKETKIKPAKIKLDTVYEDRDIIVINKHAGMVVHPGAGNFENTLVNALVFKYKKDLSDINGKLRPGIVHRIDKETSGLLVVAKNNLAHFELGKQFSEHSIKRKYLALVWGVLRPLKGKIQTLISRSKKNRQLMSVSDINGKKAITNYNTIKIFNIKNIPKISLIECELQTGRTHQIRVHMSFKGNPLLGDKQYGKKNLKFKRINKDFEKKISIFKQTSFTCKEFRFLSSKK